MPDPTRRFETERTRRFRQGGLSERDERTISNVETFGCEVVQVRRSSAALVGRTRWGSMIRVGNLK